MNLTYKDGLFICNCTFQEKETPKQAGFRWDKDKYKWTTTDASIASRLSKVADANALAVIHGHIVVANRNIDSSRASTSDAVIPCPKGIDYLPFQKAGIEFICRQLGILNKEINPSLSKSGCLLADEMG